MKSSTCFALLSKKKENDADAELTSLQAAQVKDWVAAAAAVGSKGHKLFNSTLALGKSRLLSKEKIGIA